MKFTITSWLLIALATSRALAAPIAESAADSSIDDRALDASSEDGPEYISLYDRDVYAPYINERGFADLEARAPGQVLASIVPTSSNPKDWPTKQKLESILSTPKDKAWFWTGRIKDENGEGLERKAAELSQKAGGTTLDLLLKNGGVKMPQWGSDPTHLWETASDIYASKASGKVTVLRGEWTRKGNTWDTVEFPRVTKKGSHVTQIVQVQPLTPSRSVAIWPKTSSAPAKAPAKTPAKAPAKAPAKTSKTSKTSKTTKSH